MSKMKKIMKEEARRFACSRLARLTVDCGVARYRLVQVHQILQVIDVDKEGKE